MFHEFLQISPFPLAVSVVLLLIVGRFVGPILNLATDTYKFKDGEALWRDIPPGGGFVGVLEQIAFFFAFLLGVHIFIGAWLVFKVAAKWESWGNIVRLKETRDGNLDSDSFEIRHRFGTWLLNRFLIGTLLNILLAGSAAWFYFWKAAALSG